MADRSRHVSAEVGEDEEQCRVGALMARTSWATSGVLIAIGLALWLGFGLQNSAGLALAYAVRVGPLAALLPRLPEIQSGEDFRRCAVRPPARCRQRAAHITAEERTLDRMRFSARALSPVSPSSLAALGCAKNRDCALCTGGASPRARSLYLPACGCVCACARVRVCMYACACARVRVCVCACAREKPPLPRRAVDLARLALLRGWHARSLSAKRQLQPSGRNAPSLRAIATLQVYTLVPEERRSELEGWKSNLVTIETSMSSGIAATYGYSVAGGIPGGLLAEVRAGSIVRSRLRLRSVASRSPRCAPYARRRKRKRKERGRARRMRWRRSL